MTDYDDSGGGMIDLPLDVNEAGQLHHALYNLTVNNLFLDTGQVPPHFRIFSSSRHETVVDPMSEELLLCLNILMDRLWGLMGGDEAEIRRNRR